MTFRKEGRRGRAPRLVLGIALSLLAGVSAVRAEEAQAESGTPQPLVREGPFTAFSLYTDQDTFKIPSSDQDYTMGLQFTFAGAWVKKSGVDAPLRLLDWLFLVNKVHAGRVDAGIQSHSFAFGDSAFTPLKGPHGAILAETAPRYDDRPYANLLFASVRRQTFRFHTAITSELTVGVLGLKVGEAVQTWIHAHKNPPDVRPGGWRHQISDGRELTLRYRAAVQQVLFRGFVGGPVSSANASIDDKRDTETRALAGMAADRVRWIDSVADVEGNLGYYTNVGGGLKIRLGRIMSSPFGERLAINTTKGVQRLGRGGERPWELYAWGGVGGTLWVYNALFQGQFRDSDVTIGFSPRPPGQSTLERTTTDWQVGLTASFKKFSGSYVYSGHGALFEGPNARSHSWGGIFLTFYH
jgi:hypothetical protein